MRTLHVLWTAAMTASWRSVPATMLVILGAVLLVWGLRAFFRPMGPVWMQGFRRGVIGIGLLLLGLGWLWQQPWVIAVGLIFGGEETYESSWILAYWNETPRKRVT